MKASQPKPSKLASYLTASLGAGCLAGQADAAILVTFYGPGAQNSGSTPATPAGISVGYNFYADNYYAADVNAYVAWSTDTMSYFTNGANLVSDNWGYGTYVKDGLVVNGATLNSDQNYANITFNIAAAAAASDPETVPFEAVGQFYFDGTGNGYLVAMARTDDDSDLSISAGKTAIDAVPEPSALALLALGAGGLLTRRQRKAA